MLGQPLSMFNSTQQLCEVIRDAIVGKQCCCLLDFPVVEGLGQLIQWHMRRLTFCIGM